MVYPQNGTAVLIIKGFRKPAGKIRLRVGCYLVTRAVFSTVTNYGTSRNTSLTLIPSELSPERECSFERLKAVCSYHARS